MKSNHLFLTLILLFASVTLSWGTIQVNDTILPNGSTFVVKNHSGAVYGGTITSDATKMLFSADNHLFASSTEGTCVKISITFSGSYKTVECYVRDAAYDEENWPDYDIEEANIIKPSGRSSVGALDLNKPSFWIEAYGDDGSAEARATQVVVTWNLPEPKLPATPVTYVSEENGLFFALAHDGENVTSIEVQMVDGMVICSAANQEKITWYLREADDAWEDNGDYTLQTADEGKYLKLARKAFSLVNEPGATCAFWSDNENNMALSQANTTISCTSEGIFFDEYHPFGEIDVDASTFDNNVSAYTFSRTFNNTNYSTICLPYAVPAAKFSGFTLYNITGVERDSKTNKVLYFTMEESEVLEAGVPYIIQADAAGTVRLPYAGNRYTGNTRPVATGLVGNLTGATFQINASDNAYILSQNEAHLIAGTATANIANNRAYLDLNSVDAPASTSPRRVVLGVYETEQEDVVTDLDALLETAAVLDWSKPVYNLMGQRVSEGATGVLIQDGQKFMIR